MHKILIKPSFYLLITLLLISTACVPVAVTGVGSAAAITMSKDRTKESMFTDLKIANSIKMNFIKQDFNNLYAKINIEVFNGRVMLTGYLDNNEDREKALDIVKSTTDVIEIIDELQVINKKVVFNATQYTKDSLITSQIKSKIFLEKEIKGRNYIVVTNYNIVYMFGVAASSEELEKVANIAANINGVEKVVSHVLISDDIYDKKSYNDANIESNNKDEEYITVKEINTEWSKY
ncbi:MAG: BON domain-containing protein [Rickettsiaceae bacterium]|nr:BON domain-containing protein [Rickettsiaceae bacterium]